MTHYNINYGKAKRDKALADIRKYVGKKTWAKLEHLAKAGAFKDKEDMVTSFSLFLGIEGYPVRAFAEEYLPEIAKTWDKTEPMADNGNKRGLSGLSYLRGVIR